MKICSSQNASIAKIDYTIAVRCPSYRVSKFLAINFLKNCFTNNLGNIKRRYKMSKSDI